MNDKWKFKPCPFCGHDDIAVKEKIIDYEMGNDCPSSALMTVWAYCRYCQAESGKTTISAVCGEDVRAVAVEKWNKRSRRGRKGTLTTDTVSDKIKSPKKGERL